MMDIDEVARVIHAVSTEKGFTPPSLDNLPEKLMLSVSELSEALEEHRAGRSLIWHKWTPPAGFDWPVEVHGNKIEIDGREAGSTELLEMGWDKKPEGILVEIADSIIRNLHMMQSLLDQQGWDLSISDIITEKVSYNAGRPEKHGKAY